MHRTYFVVLRTADVEGISLDVFAACARSALPTFPQVHVNASDEALSAYEAE